MDRAAYASMNAQEADHWWFVARRAILAALIERHMSLPQDAQILEAGCGTGGNLDLLSRFGRVDALEYDGQARGIAHDRGVARVEAGALPHQIGFGDRRYDMIALLDVLEHVDADVASLHALGGRLAKGGRILLTVPAVPSLWSDHDVLHHHKRRYTQEALEAAATNAGLQVQSCGYFNSLLFPLALAQRVAHRAFHRGGALDARPSPWLNRTLQGIFASERHLLGRVSFPIGLSLYAVLAA